MISLHELQLQQRNHDERYHRDIYYLDVRGRLKHTSSHLGKYSARIARLIRESEQGRTFEIPALQRTLVDSMLMMLNAAELFNMDLGLVARQKFNVGGSKLGINELGRLLRPELKTQYAWLSERDPRKSAIGLLLDYTDRAGVIHKACDSIDHFESISREAVMDSIFDEFVIVLLAGLATDINYEKSVPDRWREIERARVL